jgi:predicted helicase
MRATHVHNSAMDFKKYLARVGSDLKAGNATEHTHRPALQALIESAANDLRATNEPRRIACGAPDYIVTRTNQAGNIPLGYIEAKDVGKELDAIEGDEQLRRYRSSLRNLILTDYLEFRLYRNGELVQTARLAKWHKNGVLKADPDGAEQVERLLKWFIESDIPTIASPRELAQRMAQMARMTRDLISQAFLQEADTAGRRGELHAQFEGFRRVLLGDDLTPEQFADMYAQTICYGLFAARCNHMGATFTRQGAAYDLPKTNPFLRKLFQSIAGADLDERISWAVDDLADLLAKADMGAVLADFGKATRQEDPVVHFYETFLAAYDPALRQSRGVYYTPEPVVSYIVRSVDAILKSDFDLPAGLADSSKVSIKRATGKLDKKGVAQFDTVQTHRVQILDPATGTGTFLYSVIAQIRESFAGNAGMWPGYVAEHLLPRIYGFELLMAPYSVAHMKLGLQLKDSGYDFASDERLRVYLTNTLEKAHELTGLPLFTQWLAEEAAQAGDVKQSAPIMVVLGNPPYSGNSANTGEWIAGLLRGVDSLTGQKTGNYFEADGAPLGERNPKYLNDDYVKFIRFSQWRIEQTGYGVLAFVTNHGYLDNPTFRGMRQSLLETFGDIYILDLHGSTKKKESALDGSKDENVFDIQQGVSIGIFVKRKDGARKSNDKSNVHHADLYGLRSSKYEWLWSHDVNNTQWHTLVPQSPSYMLVQQDLSNWVEYEKAWKVTDVFPTNSTGIKTARDALTITWSRDEVWQIVRDFSTLSVDEARDKYEAGPDTRDWQVELAQNDLLKSGPDKSNLAKVLYRPFDVRNTYYTGNSRGFHSMPRGEVMGHMFAGDNLGLGSTRATEIGAGWEHIFAFNTLFTHHSVSLKEANYLFPLYLYLGEKKSDLFDQDSSGPASVGRIPNLSPEFITDLSAKLKLKFQPDGGGDLKKTFGPEDIFHYTYAVLYAPSYRTRYAEFLKRDFPRLPLTSDAKLFAKLCALGQELVALHLMTTHAAAICTYPIAGSNRVDKVSFDAGRISINTEQYFDGVPTEVWNYHIGGYQVAHKWLKDRKGRLLSFADLQHYQHVIGALAQTIRLQAEINTTIPAWPLV